MSDPAPTPTPFSDLAKQRPGHLMVAKAISQRIYYYRQQARVANSRGDDRQMISNYQAADAVYSVGIELVEMWKPQPEHRSAFFKIVDAAMLSQ